MTDNKTTIIDSNDEAFDQKVLNEYPYPVAVQYQKLLDAQSWQDKITNGLRIYEFGLRTVTLSIINQYLNENIKHVNDEDFNQLLLSKLPEATLGSWVELFFRSLQIYHGKQELFFTQELYEILWDTSQEPHEKRKGVRSPFQRLVELRNANAHLRLADTEENAQEVKDNLQAVLAQFAFIEKYDLIRITKINEDGGYNYDIYRGLTKTSETGALKLWRAGNKELEQGWFYLMRKSSRGREVLELHPFIVSWVSDENQRTPGGQLLPISTGVALYDRLLKSKVTYIKLEDQDTLEHEHPHIDRMLAIIHYEIQEVRMGQGGKTGFDWEELKTAAQELSFRNMKGIKEKYSAELYLQREETFQQFNDFLESDETCFVLTGKSGVGKSNFVLSLVDIYSEQDKICYLMYDGARLAVPDLMQDTIGQDLGRRLGLVDEIKKSFFKSLKNQGSLSGNRKLLIVFDAINENADGKKLLEKIDQLIRIGDDYPWLKVLITSRPQAWRTMKRGLHLADENYFRPKGEDDRVVEMSEFAIKLEEFERGELELAYEKYRLVYNLQTPYERLPVSIRETLRDPLVLRLVAEIYKDKSMPETVRVSDIYEQYVNKLVETERLELQDIIFLEQEIVARMLSADTFDNKLTTEEVAQAKTRDGRPLWEMLRIAEVLSTGEAINASYHRLAEAEILIQQGSPTDYEISFKYERFYDYYGGKRLRALADQKPAAELESTYKHWIVATRKYPFLWGSVQSALLHELKKGSESLIIDLCQTDQQVVKDMLVATLTDWGEEEPGKLSAVLAQLLTLGNDKLGVKQKMMSWQSFELPDQMVNAKKIALDVAGNLGNKEILVAGNLDRTTDVRIQAIRQTMNLWQRDWQQENGSSHKGNRGFETFKMVLSQARTGLLPNMQAAESGGVMLFYIVLTTIGKIRRGEEEELGKELRYLVRELLNKLLYIGEGKFSERMMRAPIRELVINTVVRVATRTTNDSPESFAFNPRTANAFLKRDPADKEVLLTVTRYYDSRNEDVERLAAALPQVLKLNEPLVDHAVSFAFLAQWNKNREQVLEMARFVFEEGMKHDPPHYITYAAVGILSNLFLQGYRDEALETLYLDWQKQVIEKAKGRLYLSGDLYLRSDFANYILLTHTLHQQGETEFPIRLIEEAIEEKNIHFLRAIILELRVLASNKDLHQSMLQVAVPLLKCINNKQLETREEIEKGNTERERNTLPLQQQVLNMLARFRRFAPEDVDDFMVVNELPQEIQTTVKTIEVSEEIGGDFINRPLGAAIVEVMLNSTDLQPIGQWIVAKSVDCTSLDQWFNIAFKRIMNLAYGDDIFSLES